MLVLQRIPKRALQFNGVTGTVCSTRLFHHAFNLNLQQSFVPSEERRYRNSNRGFTRGSDSNSNNKYRNSSYDDNRSRSNYGGDKRNNRNNNNYGNNRNNGSRRRYQDENSDIEVFKSKSFNVTTLNPESFHEQVTIDSLLEESLLDANVHKAISAMKFESLTPVQQRTIKPILTTENDVVAKAKTGTGKTLAFLAPLFQHLISTKLQNPLAVKAVIVTPTRDLAIQIASEVKKLQQCNPSLKSYRSLTLIGGTNLDKSLKDLHTLNPNIIVGTPGRINDILDRVGAKYFKDVDFKVLDEADTLLQIGFQTELSLISRKLNEFNTQGEEHIRTLLFSATMDHNVQELAATIMNKKDCLFIDTVDKNDSEAHDSIDQKLVITKSFAESMVALIQSIESELLQKKNFKAILFLPTVKFVDFFSETLSESLTKRIDIIKFHGKIDQKKRTKLVDRFKKTNHGIFVCTDVGARGMHFPSVEHVYQLCVPTSLPNYIHRIGRTARAGESGAATIFLFREELKFVDELRRDTNVVIKNQEDYLNQDKENFDMISSIITNNPDFPEALKSIIGFYKGVQNEYRLNYKVAQNVLRSFSELHSDSSMLLRFRPSEINNFFSNRDMRFVSDLIDVKNPHSFGKDREFDDEDRYTSRSQNNYKSKQSSKSNRFEGRNDYSNSRRSHANQKRNFTFDD
ncbi:ATP-dependent RNA helicase [Kluyveromyces lactis]|uniref:ATP-dependent RNA helicase MSS116, mitochondrial n=1 Tax=Kluyveromyces lactis (strain ATCC 8585 / CBS 2359 / DSM 70799 / NBRC 1267 / NRRL Y-1140 / WM37) TaxID=284590 RepID=MS116_KLULA|nr:uncharacterized protein KLLA0_D18667g [Kluyveromyces lactis]Q6CQA1.1 RecName: Full=ATP-dependent RNA helicase MSS116, mitochondrial; Flags: Precursor [Kluyveromyces lactis NRRL Y-1140]CAH00984.1 KLLA0D18667p [Kluyveromyces lactis]|eukprot:XP_453888.1 uncharacterized protein KLLA0_D18667g [Kluyveromyces lactis]